MSSDPIYKIVATAVWRALEAQQGGDAVFRGNEKDISDGYIHFSSADQISLVLNKWYKNYKNDGSILIVRIDTDAYKQWLAAHNGELKWEKASLAPTPFAHGYGGLPTSVARQASVLRLSDDGVFSAEGMF